MANVLTFTTSSQNSEKILLSEISRIRVKINKRDKIYMPEFSSIEIRMAETGRTKTFKFSDLEWLELGTMSCEAIYVDDLKAPGDDLNSILQLLISIDLNMSIIRTFSTDKINGLNTNTDKKFYECPI